MRRVAIAVIGAWLVAACSAPPDNVLGGRAAHAGTRSSQGTGGADDPASSGPSGTTSQGQTTGSPGGSAPSPAGAPDPSPTPDGGAATGAGGGHDAGGPPRPPPTVSTPSGCQCGCADACLGALIALCEKVPTAPGCDEVASTCACQADCSNGPGSCLTEIGNGGGG